MKLRDIVESYEGLPDEDQFRIETYCLHCSPARRATKMCTCGVGWCDHHQEYETPKAFDGHDQDQFTRCPNCMPMRERWRRLKIGPFRESYAGLPDEDEFGNEALERMNQNRHAAVLFFSMPGGDAFAFGSVEELSRQLGEFEQLKAAGKMPPDSYAEINSAGYFADTLDWETYEGAPLILDYGVPAPPHLTESYEGLPDEDQFADRVCACCGTAFEDGEEYVDCLGCDNVHCESCAQSLADVYPLDYTLEVRGIDYGLNNNAVPVFRFSKCAGCVPQDL